MNSCRSCNSTELNSIIPLGEMPLANGLSIISDYVDEHRYNLEVILCASCGLAQLRDLIDPEKLFSNYMYFSSNSNTMLQFAEELVNSLVTNLTKESFVVEIASNDGYLLKNYLKHNIRVLGIDPAQNIARVANENGIETLCEFFSEQLALDLANKRRRADIIHANNVMAHIPDINGFVKGIKTLLKPNGRAIIEVPYFLDLVQKQEFDTIYHEHVYYFSVKSLKAVFERHGLELFDIEKINLHGGTLRLSVGHHGLHPIRPVIQAMINIEEKEYLYNLNTYKKFMLKLNDLKLSLVSLLKKLKASGEKIAAYGASAKGTTLLNFFGIDKSILDFVVDRSIVKQNLYTPGTKLIIKNPSALISEGVNSALLLTWNFAEEIFEQQHEFISKGGKFIIPLPEVKLLP